MKLVEILAKGLEEWPDHTGAAGISQDGSRVLNRLDRGVEIANAAKCPPDVATWPSSTWTRFSLFEPAELATDHSTAIVTRADWEAERAKLKAPKANGDGWIRHRGGKCPVEAGVRVDYRMRNGRQGINERSELLDWRRSDESQKSDIMAYRIHKPAEQPDEHDLTSLAEKSGIKRMAAVASEVIITSGPLEWRDRIRALDTQRAEVESTYQRQISEITQERESLVQKLAGEGFSLIGDNPGTLLTWQRYAKDGMKINAIKEYRNLTGAGLPEAKRAVEEYQDSLD